MNLLCNQLCQRPCLFKVPCIPQKTTQITGLHDDIDDPIRAQYYYLGKKQKFAILLASFGRLNGKMEMSKVKWPMYSSSACSMTERGRHSKRAQRKRFPNACFDFKEGVCISSSIFISLQTFLHLMKNIQPFFFKYINK